MITELLFIQIYLLVVEEHQQGQDQMRQPVP